VRWLAKSATEGGRIPPLDGSSGATGTPEARIRPVPVEFGINRPAGRHYTP